MKTTTLALLGVFALSPLASAIAQTTDSENKQQARDNSDTIEQILVEGRRNAPNTELTAETEQLLRIAGIDNDPLAAVFSLPGVVYAGGDFGGEPAIRGSSPEDNAFYIDNMPVDYIFHVFGDSIFNKNLVRDFDLYPAGFDSSFGNATGGVFDVKLRDPRDGDITTIVDFSLLKTGVMVEGGIAQDHAFYFSYRRSQMHLFIDEDEEDEGIKIFKAPISDDFQGRYQWLIGDNQKFTYTLAGASDEAGISISEASEEGRADPDSIGDLRVNTEFTTHGLNWQYYGEDQQILSVSLSHTSESELFNYGQGQFADIDEAQTDFRINYQTDWLASHRLTVGVDFSNNDVEYSFDAIPYYCTDHQVDCAAAKGERIAVSDELVSKDYGVYIEDHWVISQDIELTSGLRAERNSYTDQSFVHPRFSLTYFATDSLTVSAKAGSYSRFPEIETALSKVGNPNIKSPKAQHYSIGANYEINDLWSASVDVYHKKLSDLALSLTDIDAEAYGRDGDLFYSDDLSGTANGIEFIVRRDRADGWYGWASLSWSKSDRTNDLTNATTEYYLDTPLLANMVANYKLNDKWDFGLRFTLRSGAKYTPIVGLRPNPDYPENFLPNYGELNSETLPVYHRLDLQANYKTSLWGYPAEVTLATINTLNRKNVSGYYYAPDGTETLTDYKIDAEEGIGIFPSIGLKVTF